MAISVDEGAASLVAGDREHFWNLPNTITVLRIGVVPVLLLLPYWSGQFASQVIAWSFIVAAITDIVDGWLARRGQQVTQIGKLLDPVADKLIVSTALVVLLAVGRIPTWAIWMVVVIVGRELAVTGLRGLASVGGRVMAASWQGKAKTLMQNIAIAPLLFHYTTFGLPANSIGSSKLAFSPDSNHVVFTADISGDDKVVSASLDGTSAVKLIEVELICLLARAPTNKDAAAVTNPPPDR